MYLELRRYVDTVRVITIRNTVFQTLLTVSQIAPMAQFRKKQFAHYFWDIVSLTQENAADLHTA
jgi:hypothetical protein